MRVAVTGACGRMGGWITQNVLSNDDMELVAVFDVVNIGSKIDNATVSDPKEMRSELKETKSEVMIDFTFADISVQNIKAAVECDTNIVVGSTGFSEDQKKEIAEVIGKNITAVISPNFSIGVNVFWKLIGEAQEYLKDYDVEIVEIHHKHKKDAPSGTAVYAAELLGDKFVHGRSGICPRNEGEIGVHSVRGGDVVGDHTVLFAGEGERLEIIHRAHSRQSFASGAMKAARWVMTAEKGIHSFDEVLGL
ncbi:MAG: 4-hydroxy-tetrahydrodipicolinate reductase [Halobacteriota archaeon]|nr:4-hydroxy-tetrahydrodipicolinate reductase [Halobacteriota archaeon]